MSSRPIGFSQIQARSAKSAAQNLETHYIDSCQPKTHKPRICILADCPGWAYDNSARQIKRQLEPEFDITIRYGSDHPSLSLADYDLIHICFWEESRYQQIGLHRERIIKEVSSHRWQYSSTYGPCTPDEFARRYLMNCDTVICTSRRLTAILEKVVPHTFHTPNGIDVTRFAPGERRTGPGLVYGWAGNAKDEIKGFSDIVQPACGGRFELRAATGDLSHSEMANFYREVDVFIVASRHEGEPLTLIEAMASGCFPVCVDVGIVPELIEHGRNGYIVPERSVKAFQDAFEWCERHYDEVRAAGLGNAELIARERNWSVCAEYFTRVYRDTLVRADRLPKPPRSNWSNATHVLWTKAGLTFRRRLTRIKSLLRSWQR